MAVLFRAASIHVKICPASLPPPVASKAMVAPVAISAWVKSAMKVGELALQTWLAPRLLKSVSCSGLRTILTRPMLSLIQILLSI